MDFKLLLGNNFVKCKWNTDDTVGVQEILVERFSDFYTFWLGNYKI